MSTSTFVRSSPAAVIVRTRRDACEHSAMPPGMNHEEPLVQMQKDAELKKRARGPIGVPLGTRRHTPLQVAPAGGAMRGGRQDSGDDVARAQIRTHLKTIANNAAGGLRETAGDARGRAAGVQRDAGEARNADVQVRECGGGGRVRITASTRKDRRVSRVLRGTRFKTCHGYVTISRCAVARRLPSKAW